MHKCLSNDIQSINYAPYVGRRFEWLYREHLPHIFLQGNFTVGQIGDFWETDKKSRDQQAEKRWLRRLGTSVKKFSKYDPFDHIDKVPGLALPDSEKSDRRRRFILQDAIRLNNLVDQNIKNCCRIAVAKMVSIGINTETGSAGYHNIHTCKSVWGCPVCRQRILKRRAEQIDLVYDRAKEKGYRMYHVTYTIRHHKNDNLAALYGRTKDRSGITGAMAKMRGWRGFRELKEKIEYLADWRSVEITYSKKNGFHPHIHQVIIAKGNLSETEIQDKLLKLWGQAVLKSGLKDINDIGVKVKKDISKKTAKYTVKWGISGELTSDQKTGKKAGNFSIGQIENMLIEPFFREENNFEIYEVTKTLGIYYQVMKGQKLLQTAGDKSIFKEISEEMDQQAAEAVESQENENREYIGEIRSEDYSKICKAGYQNRLKDIIEDAYNREGCLIYVNELLKRHLKTMFDINLIAKLE